MVIVRSALLVGAIYRLISKIFEFIQIQVQVRVLTLSDFDGLACHVLFIKAGMIDEVEMTHPKQPQDGKVDVTSLRHCRQRSLCAGK